MCFFLWNNGLTYKMGDISHEYDIWATERCSGPEVARLTVDLFWGGHIPIVAGVSYKSEMGNLYRWFPQV
jgi:hypothetical protein